MCYTGIPMSLDLFVWVDLFDIFVWLIVWHELLHVKKVALPSLFYLDVKILHCNYLGYCTFHYILTNVALLIIFFSSLKWFRSMVIPILS